MNLRSFNYYSLKVEEKNSKKELGKLLEKITENTLIPQSEKNDLYLKIFQKNWKVIKVLDENKLTPQICASAVKCKWKALEYIPLIFKSDEICEIATKESIYAFEWVPADSRTENMFAKHLPNNWIIIFSMLLNYKKDPTNLYLKVVKENGEVLEHIPVNRRNSLICETSIDNTWEALEHVPDNIENYNELCMKAININGMALGLVTETKRTDLMKLTAVSKNWEALKLIKDDANHYEKLCEIAIDQNWLACNLVAPTKLNPSLRKRAIQKNWEAIKFFTEDQINPEIAMLAVSQNWKALQFIPKDLITPKMCEIALQQDWKALEFIPDSIENYNLMCANCIKIDKDAIKFISQNKITPEMAEDVTNELQKEVEKKLNLPANSFAKCGDDSCPTIVMLYNPPGVTYANSLIDMLYALNKNIKIALVLPHIGKQHPIFNHPECIHGIILPGGDHINGSGKPNNERYDFEKFLFDLAQSQNIPGLAVCRGHQFIGVQYGAKLTEVDNHSNETRVIRIKNKNDNPLHKKLSNTIHKEESLLNSERPLTKHTLNVERDKVGTLFYQAACVHEQQIKFRKGERNQAVTILGKDKDDKTVESMQAGSFITFQHHLEAAYLSPGDPSLEKRVSNKLIKLYIENVTQHHTDYHNSARIAVGGNALKIT